MLERAEVSIEMLIDCDLDERQVASALARGLAPDSMASPVRRRTLGLLTAEFAAGLVALAPRDPRFELLVAKRLLAAARRSANHTPDLSQSGPGAERTDLTPPT